MWRRFQRRYHWRFQRRLQRSQGVKGVKTNALVGNDFSKGIYRVIAKWWKHALKGQKLLAQGNALGIKVVSNAPCKGKSFEIHLMKLEIPLRYVKLLPLQGALLIGITTQGVALGYELLPLQGVLVAGGLHSCLGR